MKRSIAILASSCTLLAAACDKEPTADFAKATQEQRVRALVAGMGADAMLGVSLTALIAGLAEQTGAACPKVETKGNVKTVTGGCQLPDGGPRLEGSVVFDGDLDSGTGTITFDNWKFVADDASFAVDGEVSFDEKTHTIEIHTSTDLSMAGLAGKASNDLVLTCTDKGVCTAGEESSIEVEKLGTADVRGTWTAGEDDEESASGTLELQGVNTLKADLKKDANGCFAITIDGKAADPICLDKDEEEGDKAKAKALPSLRSLKSFVR